MTASQPKPVKIAAVVVTRNRLALLKECLAALTAQTRAVDQVIVIDNASDDGTAEWLATQPNLTIVRQGNLGGAGGFHAGIKMAYHCGHDWFWCMDDDTVPNPDCLERLLLSPSASEPATGFLSSLVQWTDGSLHLMNRPTTESGKPFGFEMDADAVPIRNASFVSLLVRREAVAKCGLPLAPMFIWVDDVEFTSRIASNFKGYLIPASRALHKTPKNTGGGLESLNDATAAKFRYGLRNWVLFTKRSVTPYHFYNIRAAIRQILRTTPVLFRQCSLRIACRLFLSMLGGLTFNPRVEFP